MNIYTFKVTQHLFFVSAEIKTLIGKTNADIPDELKELYFKLSDAATALHDAAYDYYNKYHK